MDINQIITSGLLEMYVLGLTTAEETRQVEEWRAQYPQVNEEIAQIEEMVHEYVQQYDKAPPAGLKEKILAELTLQRSAVNPHRPTLKVRRMQYGIAASIALLAVSMVFNILYYNRWQQSAQQVARLEGEKQEIFAQNKTRLTALEKAEGQLQVLKSPTLKVVSLTSGKINKPELNGLVTVYWDTAKNNVFVNVNSLPPAPEGKQYQLWALVNGAPVDAGIMEFAPDTLQQLKTIAQAQAFAITLENRGGAAQPTLEQMVVMGEI